MIHHSSTDPVLVKKISLKVWTLRDEIEARIKAKLELSGTEDLNEADLSEIKNTYSSKKDAEVVQINAAESLDNSEDEMKKAMEEAMNPEASTDAPTDSTESMDNTETSETNNVTPLFQNSNVIEINAEMPPLDADKIFKGKTVLAEIGMDKIFFFSNKKFTEGQSVLIKFEIPKTFIMSADVHYCRPFNLKSRIISENNFQFRVMAKFSFMKEGERALLRQFLKSVEPETQPQAPASESKAEKSDEGDFSELDDLI